MCSQEANWDVARALRAHHADRQWEKTPEGKKFKAEAEKAAKASSVAAAAGAKKATEAKQAEAAASRSGSVVANQTAIEHTLESAQEPSAAGLTNRKKAQKYGDDSAAGGGDGAVELEPLVVPADFSDKTS